MSTTIAAPGAHAPVLAPGELVLKYLFGALLANGEQVFQTPEDVSASTPGRNAIYDLMVCSEDGTCIEHPVDGRIFMRHDIDMFVLQTNGVRYLVDLRDAHFEVQHLKGKVWHGSHFYLGFPPAGAKLRPFYFKRRRAHLNVSGIVRDDMTLGDTKTVEVGQECEYHFGWETLDRSQHAEMILT